MKIFKKTLAMLLSIVMVFGVMPASVFTASAADACPIEGATGTGTEADPVIVDTFAELKAALTYSSELYVQVDTDIECTESIKVNGSKTLTVNGKLYSNTTILMGPGTPNSLIIQGTGSMVSDDLCVNALGYVTLRGNVTYESTGESTVFSNTSNLRIEGGTFKNDEENCHGLQLNNKKVVFAGGSFPGGIDGFSDGTYELENGYMFSYEDGSVSSVLQPDVPVDVVYIGKIDLSFATQTPAMPEGETATYLGDFTVGDAGAKITFSFSATPLADEAVNSNYSIVEKMTVYSTKNGLILEQSSGASYTIDNTVADVYTITETLTLMHKGFVIQTLVHIFTVAIHPEGYVADCPIEGATGTGTKEDPVIVDTFEELKAALTYSDELYVQADTDIDCTESIKVKGSKTLTVNGTLYGSKTLFVCYNGSQVNFVLKGMGTLRSENNYAVEIQYYNEVKICENLTLISENFTPVTCSGSLIIEGGEFLSNKKDEYSLTNYGTVTFSGGSFPNGIYNHFYSERILADGCWYRYEDGTLSKELQANVPVDVINIGDTLGFATQIPAMPEGKTETFLGNYTVGTEEAKITFGFTVKPLHDLLKNAGFTTTEKMTVISAKNGVIKTQNSGEAYTIDNTVADSFTVYQTITVLDADGDVSEEITNTFTVSIQPVGYIPDANCPIEGATGSGTKADPVIVDTYAELKAALEYSEKLYIQTDGYIECLETLKPAAGKTLTVNGTLHSENHIFEVWYSGFVLQGNGKITTEQGYCLSNTGSDTIIAGNLEIHSGGVGYHTINASAGKLTISGGTISNSFHRSLNVSNDETVILKSGKFLNGISGNATLSSESFYQYEDGTLSNTLQQNVPVNVFCLEFATQTPAMPEGQTTANFAEVCENEKISELTFSFTSKTLPKESIELGYSILEEMTVYNKTQGKVVHTQSNGNAYTITDSILDAYTVTETIKLVKDGEAIATLTHTFTIDDIDNTYGFTSHTPELSEEDAIDGLTDLGVIFEAPSFSYTARDIPDYLKDAGYKLVPRTRIWHTDTAVQESEDPYSWTCGVYDYGTKQVRQSLMVYAPNGTLVSAYHHTYTFTYLPLKFDTRIPSVSTAEAAAGVSNLGTLTTAQTFSFSAMPLDFTLKEEGYSIALKTEAYQGDKLVYTADNGDNYIHIYQGEGKVVQTIYILNADGEVVGSKSHTYNFTMDFPDGTITLDSDYLTIAEGSSQAITATVIPESLANTLVWTSSNPSIAKVDKNGTVTAVRAGSAIITATLGNGATAYCPVLVTASDVKAYVGGVGLAEGEYLVWGNYAPTTVKPSDHYAYLATVNGTLTLTLHNYSYSGEGTFISKNAAYGIYSSSALKIVAEGENRIGAMSAPLERYTSYGIGSASTVSFSSDSSSFLTIRGVSTGISSSSYVFVSGNLNIENAASGISCTHAQAMGGLNFQSGNVNINCTGTAITVTGNYINFAGANVNINCKNGINLVRQGTILVDGGSLEMYASASGINLKSGMSMTVESGTVYIEAANNGIALAGALTVNDGSMVVKSTDTESDSTYSALNGTGTVTLSSNVKAFASTQSTAESTVTFNSANMGNYDYVLFEGSGHVFVKQPVGGEIGSTEKMTVTWETGFIPLKIELVTYDGTSLSYTTLDAAATSAELGALPEGGYYQIKANYSASHYVTSERFYITTKTHTVIFGYGLTAQYQYVKDGECAVKPADPTSSGYFFAGWWTEEGEPYDFSTPVTGRLTLVPRWSEVKLNGVAIPNGSYLGQHSGAVTTGKPSDHWAYYKDGVLTLYNFDSSYGAGIEFGEIDLTVVSSGNGNAVSCIVSDYDYANLTIDGTATLNIGHELWTYNAIYIYDTVTFKCDTVIECIDSVVVCDVEGFVVDGADVIIKGYADMAWANGIYGCEAPITVLDGSLYIYCEGGETITDSYITNPDRVTVYANNNLDAVFTDDDIITKVDEAYDLVDYSQIKIVHKHTTVIREGVKPTCKTTGIADYYECICGRIFSDAECTNEITDLEAWKSGEGVLPVSDHNWTNLDGVCAFGCGTKAFETKNGAIIDNASSYIYGLDAGITSVDSYFNVLVDGAEWEYELGQFGGFGTGTKATLKKDDTTVAEYTILIYGDLNGDGWYDGEDAFLANLIVKGMLKQADLPDYMWKAADCNHDGEINETDVDILTGAGLKLNSVDQNKVVSDLLSNSDYIEYAMLIDQSAGMSVEPDIDNSQQGITTPETNETVEPDEPAEDSYFGIFISKIFLFIRKIFNFIFSFVIK